ncbi:hypothetical protein I3843_09G219700 [Carya illinoinensis]|uniref:RING-type E3 ubiquitin transferase n=1 Tax=Carya illinoinensis TaxID=32201 RepID=A0A8T1PL50_CARIL|nr:uncharacterized protein LOC122275392 [Carya illinoinensis]KAG2691186.1 hypothetical protein I3760_09G224700 [Carya illinoinensis]KAG2691187.1 hypothetical protein I3760_09G224700 [Carya illinoinensis]KAG6643615.1 hypothetical protein CIPAW_09G223900 [Carya illinoinensis]KAG6697960.1 hypothetical protein I3842_09G227500 [Carya illinoinensis]KAG6697961.1 hypothetical protein I3842_09G227500 [Carya illinoinensis]
MDAGSPRISEQWPQASAQGLMDSGLLVDHSVQPAACTLCQRILSPENDASGDLETVGVCGDCKFLFLEDHGTPRRNSYQRRLPRGRRTRYSSSESVENLFSQEFSHMINLARQNQSSISGNEDRSLEGDAMTRLLQHSSSRSTPSRSRSVRWVLSDTESDGVDHLDSLYGESESSFSFGQYGALHGESDAISFSAYGGDSDVSVGGHSFHDPEMFAQPDEGSIFDSDTDIDPMHAGLNQWDLEEEEEDEGEEEEEEDGVWEEADAEEYTVESAEARGRLQHFLTSEDAVSWRLREGYVHTIFGNLDEAEFLPYVRNSGDYLDASGFEELLVRLAETDSLRRGAPPAALSLVNSLPCVVIDEQHEKHEGLACAICKEVLTSGTKANQLPCFHLYHPSCILPWLTTRNSCPLCRYELPTDDKDYEEGKQNSIGRVEIHEIQQENVSEDSSSDVFDRAEADGGLEFYPGSSEERELLDVDPATDISGREGGRGRWYFLAAAPIVGLVGIVLVWWLGNPLMQGRVPPSHCSFREQRHRQIHISDSSPSQRENRSRRWWSLF